MWEILSQHTATDPYLFDQFDAQIWTSQKSKDNGDNYHIWNNWKAQFRETHQRVVVGAGKGLLWQPDKAQPPVEITDFAEFERTQAVKYKSGTVASKVEWEAQDGKKIAPFVFPTYDGVDEPLDPQFVREQHIVTMESQRERAILEYILRAEADGRSGDLRGTTLNLTVPASADDSRIFASAWSNVSGTLQMGDAGSDRREHQSRFTGATIAAAATINSCVYTMQANVTTSGTSVNMTVGFHAADNSGQVADITDFDGRTLTATTIAWTNIAAITSGVDFSSPDLKGSLQNIMDRGGWASGNAINLFLRNNATTNLAVRTADSYDVTTSLCGRLAIDYTSGGGGGPTVKTLAALGVG